MFKVGQAAQHWFTRYRFAPPVDCGSRARFSYVPRFVDTRQASHAVKRQLMPSSVAGKIRCTRRPSQESKSTLGKRPAGALVSSTPTGGSGVGERRNNGPPKRHVARGRQLLEGREESQIRAAEVKSARDPTNMGIDCWKGNYCGYGGSRKFAGPRDHLARGSENQLGSTNLANLCACSVDHHMGRGGGGTAAPRCQRCGSDRQWAGWAASSQRGGGGGWWMEPGEGRC